MNLDRKPLLLIAVLAIASSATGKQKVLPPMQTKGTGGANISSPETRAARGVENIVIPLGEGLPAFQVTLPRVMEIFKTPGVSVAIVDNFKIVSIQAFGVTDVGGTTPVTPRTLFQAGSISKAVAATGTLSLVEKGKLSLDEDVNKKLVSWKVPENEFTKDQKVTLRRILSHMAGLTVHGFPGYAAGAPIPTLVQILDGEKPSVTGPVRVDRVPGSELVYSGGGVTIEQLLVTEVSGKPFQQFMRQAVLDKIGMKDSTYEQPIPAPRAALTAAGTLKDGKPVTGRWYTYPEMAAAGLWTTPTDLAKFGIEIALSKQGKANHVLSEAMTREMLKRQGDQKMNGEFMGLGFFLGDDRRPDQFGHDGVDMGFEASLSMFSNSGRGVASMGNSNNFSRVSNFIAVSAAHQYGWPITSAQVMGGDLLVVLEAEKGTQAAIDAYNYINKERPSHIHWDRLMLSQLAGALVAKNKLDDAIQALRLSIQDDPGFWHGYEQLGRVYVRAGQTQLAIQNYEKVLELMPKNQDAADILKKLKEQK